MEKIQKQYQVTVKKEQEKAKKEKEKKLVEEIDNSMWGQMDSMYTYSKDVITKAQGFEDPEPVEEKPAPPPKPVLSPEE